MFGISAVIFLFAAASTTEARHNLVTPVEGGVLPEGLPGCEQKERYKIIIAKLLKYFKFTEILLQVFQGGSGPRRCW